MSLKMAASINIRSFQVSSSASGISTSFILQKSIAGRLRCRRSPSSPPYWIRVDVNRLCRLVRHLATSRSHGHLSSGAPDLKGETVLPRATLTQLSYGETPMGRDRSSTVLTSEGRCPRPVGSASFTARSSSGQLPGYYPGRFGVQGNGAVAPSITTVPARSHGASQGAVANPDSLVGFDPR